MTNRGQRIGCRRVIEKVLHRMKYKPIPCIHREYGGRGKEGLETKAD